jgi:hypothetical protein
MRKITKLTISVAFTLLLLGAYFVVSAAEEHKGGPSREQAAIPQVAPPPLVNEVVGRTYFTTAATNYVVLTPGFNAEDSGISFACPGPTCTVVVSSFATSGANTATGNNRALCLVVDGSIVGACAFNGPDSVDDTYSAINSINSAVVGKGNHTASMDFYTTDGTTMYTYTNIYQIYKP